MAERRPDRDRSGALQGLALLAGGAVLLVTYLASMGLNRDWWSPTLGLRFRTSTAAGLRPGMAVKISGIPVGRLRSLQLRPDGQVLVDLDLGSAYGPMLGHRSRATLAQDSLLGNPYVALRPDPAPIHRSGLGLHNGPTIVYDPRPDPQTLLTELAETRIPLQRALGAGVGLARERIPATLDELDRTLVASRRLATSLQRDAAGASAELRRTSGRVQQVLSASAGSGERTLPLLQQTLEELNSMATNTNALVRRLQESWLFDLVSPPSDRPAAGPLVPTFRDGAELAPRPQERNRRE